MFGPTSQTQARLYRLLSDYREEQGLDVLYAFGLGLILDTQTEDAISVLPGATHLAYGWEEGGLRYLEISHDGSLDAHGLQFQLRRLGLRVVEVL